MSRVNALTFAARALWTSTLLDAGRAALDPEYHAALGTRLSAAPATALGPRDCAALRELH